MTKKENDQTASVENEKMSKSEKHAASKAERKAEKKESKNDVSVDRRYACDKTQAITNEDREDNCATWAKRILKSARLSKIMQDYRENKEWKPSKCVTTICEKNHEKNRYKGILCADSNRVILKDRSSSNDYIHGSWMVMPDAVQFISTQGPLKNTAADFWHMIFTEKCHAVVMLCQFVEEEAEKCFKYFGSDCEFGDYKIKILEKNDVGPSVKYTQIQVKKKDEKEKHIVHHYWYHDWPDQIAPLDPSPMVKMYRSALSKSQGYPIAVHCSAGVGRTSTFIGIHLGSEMIKEDPNTEMSDILKELRKMRLCSIQSQLQYVFLLVCILNLFIENKIIKRDSSYDSLLKKFTDITKKVAAAIQEEEEKRRLEGKKQTIKEKEKMSTRKHMVVVKEADSKEKKAGGLTKDPSICVMLIKKSERTDTKKKKQNKTTRKPTSHG